MLVGLSTTTTPPTRSYHHSNPKTQVPQLMYEARVYRQFAGLAGFPKLRGTGEDETSRMLVIDLLGSSLEDLFDMCDR